MIRLMIRSLTLAGTATAAALAYTHDVTPGPVPPGSLLDSRGSGPKSVFTVAASSSSPGSGSSSPGSGSGSTTARDLVRTFFCMPALIPERAVAELLLDHPEGWPLGPLREASPLPSLWAPVNSVEHMSQVDALPGDQVSLFRVVAARTSEVLLVPHPGERVKGLVHAPVGMTLWMGASGGMVSLGTAHGVAAAQDSTGSRILTAAHNLYLKVLLKALASRL